jgi:hypothetical protein
MEIIAPNIIAHRRRRTRDCEKNRVVFVLFMNYCIKLSISPGQKVALVQHDVNDASPSMLISIKLTTTLFTFSLIHHCKNKHKAILYSQTNHIDTYHNVGQSAATTRPHRQPLAIRQGSRRGMPYSCPLLSSLQIHSSNTPPRASLAT